MEDIISEDKRLCECGCGTIIPKIRYRKPIRFVHGHYVNVKNPSWKGGKIIDKDGYVSIICKGHPRTRDIGYVLEHLLVMERYIGRAVRLDEVVHHINGNRQDNRIENLMLMSRGKHSRMHNIGKKRPGIDTWTTRRKNLEARRNETTSS